MGQYVITTDAAEDAALEAELTLPGVRGNAANLLDEAVHAYCRGLIQRQAQKRLQALTSTFEHGDEATRQAIEQAAGSPRP